MKTVIQNWLPRRTLSRALLTLAVLLGVTACASLPAQLTGDICNIFRAKSNWHKSALRAEKKWQLPLHVPMAVIYHESGFRRNAKPPRRYLLGFIPWKRRSSAYGYAQAVDSTWQAYRKETGNRRARRTNFNDAIDFVGWYVNKTATVNKVAKTDAYHQYLAYHEGWTGFRKRNWEQKSWLMGVASKVDQRANRYQQQYQGCARDLHKPFWQRWFS